MTTPPGNEELRYIRMRLRGARAKLASDKAKHEETQRQIDELRRLQGNITGVKWITIENADALRRFGWSDTQSAVVRTQEWTIAKMKELTDARQQFQHAIDHDEERISSLEFQRRIITDPPPQPVTQPSPIPEFTTVPPPDRDDSSTADKIAKLEQQRKQIDDQIRQLNMTRRSIVDGITHPDDKVKNIFKAVERRAQSRINTDYEAWKREHSHDKQAKKINEFLENVMTTDDQGNVLSIDMDFTPFTLDGLKMLLPRLQNIVLDGIGDLAAGEWWMTVAMDDGRYTTFVLNKDTYNKLIQGISSPDLPFDVERVNLFFQMSGQEQQFNITTFNEIHIRRRKAALDPNTPKLRSSEPAGGADFAYVLDLDSSNFDEDVKERITQYVKRLEIGVDNKAYSCFVYALKQCGLNGDLVNKINSRCLSRWLSIKNVKRLIEEFGINVQLTIYQEKGTRLVGNTLIHNEKKNRLNLALYLNHYFVLEKSGIFDKEIGVKASKNEL
jgi:hypothetical protein